MRTDVQPMKPPALRFRVLYLAFASGYLLSYLYRTVNAVISPELDARAFAHRRARSGS